MNADLRKTLGVTAKVFNIITLIGSLLILASLSYEIVYSNQFYITTLFLKLQLVVCLIFILDFILRMILSPNKWRFVLYNWILLMVSIPILNIIDWYNMEISNQWYVIFRIAPLFRGFYGLVMVVTWITRKGIVSLMASYVVTVIGFTYCASLVFFSVEQHINPQLTSFGEALWWACMNVTTVGANIFAVTTIGKILTVTIAGMGMMMFPIFTAFIINRFKNTYSTKKVASQKPDTKSNMKQGLKS